MDDYYGQRFMERDFQSSNPSGMRKNTVDNIDLDGYAGFGNQTLSHSGDQDEKMENQPNASVAALSNQSNQSINVDHANMMQFGLNNARSHRQQVAGQAIGDFQFDPSSSSQQMLMSAGSLFTAQNDGSQHAVFGQHPGQELHLNTQTANTSNYRNDMASNAGFQSPLDHNAQMNIQMPGRFLSQNMAMGLDYSGQNFQNLINSGAAGLDMLQQQNQYHSSMMMSPATQNFPHQSTTSTPDHVHQKIDRRQSMPTDQMSLSVRLESSMSGNQTHSQSNTRRQSDSGQSPSVTMQQNGTPREYQPQTTQNSETSTDNQRTLKTPLPAPQNIYQNAYSSTGFDMMMVLMKVATRKNPEINIGAVDLSCAFVVCDAYEHDFPIVYCSENFERLTGYTRHEVLHRNCRFLQSPDGKVQAGVKRSYVDDDSVLYLKNMITARREAQVSLINYRKGGQPFMNLLTMIPVSYDTDDIKFFVGFQVDLVEQPNSVTNKNPDGSYTINYQRGLTMPRYVFTPSEKQASQLESGQTVPRDEVSSVLSNISSGEVDFTKRIWDKVLLENTDDVVFVLSLKGLFLYLSPSSSKVLEYDSNELTGTALSSVCHPSDIVPVTRELKETSSSSFVNVVFRIRRKHNGYMWFEGHGSLHTEQGKGRKSIVLVGRERPVYTLSKTDIVAVGGIGDNEIWSKLSTSGMFLFVASNVRQLLDKLPEDLVGTSIQALMRQESRSEFLGVMEIAKTGKRASAKHELLNKRGQVLQAYSTVYPGDAVEGQKPTFVIAQTRLLKYSRPSGSQSRPQALAKLERDSSASVATNASQKAGALQRTDSMSGQNSTPQSVNSSQRFMSTFEAAMTYPGQQGLQLGHQDVALASEENMFDELKTTRSTSWQFELRQMEKRNRLLAEELQGLLAARKKRKRRKGNGQMEKDCANCHTRVTPEWRRGPSGNRDLCNSCGLRWAKQQGRISPRTSSQRSVHSATSDKASASQLSQVQKSPSNEEPSTDFTLDESDEEAVNMSQQTPSNPAGDITRNFGNRPSTPKLNSIERYSGGPGIGTELPLKIDEGIEEMEMT